MPKDIIKCPWCGAVLNFMYGCGWDYDRLICCHKGCHYEAELDTITYPKEE